MHVSPDAVSRRSFLQSLLNGTLLVGIASVVASIVAYLFAPSGVRSSLGPQRVKVAGAGDIPPGDGKLALVDDEPVWVLNAARGFVGMSAVCTHKGCILKWQAKRRLFACPCHDGLFDERGNVVSGLPLRPLSRFRVTVVGDGIYVAGRDDSPA
jgi:cytochrome b6-f complex iron-sulfur subunit